jgi:hypothetical protein
LNREQGRSGEFSRPPGNGVRDVVELWMVLARRNWASIVLIPADRDGSTTEIANQLAEIGQRISYGPVTAITVSSLEFGSALALADLQQFLDRERQKGRTPSPTMMVPPEPDTSTESAAASAGPASAGPQADGPAPEDMPAASPPPPFQEVSRSEALVAVPAARLIISVPPVIVEPLALKAAEDADAVVLAVRMSHSRMAEVRRTVELVGRERVAGCFLVR